MFCMLIGAEIVLYVIWWFKQWLNCSAPHFGLTLWHDSPSLTSSRLPLTVSYLLPPSTHLPTHPSPRPCLDGPHFTLHVCPYAHLPAANVGTNFRHGGYVPRLCPLELDPAAICLTGRRDAYSLVTKALKFLSLIRLWSIKRRPRQVAASYSRSSLSHSVPAT
jgi:hypothetical protein